jgi:hypothetical protein
MKPRCAILVASALVVTATLGLAIPPLAGSQAAAGARADEISSQRRHAPAYQPPPYRGFADPSFGPDGRPYPVPPYLRNQCYIDMGYGRFQSCAARS